MLRRNVTILLLLLLVPCFMMGQSQKVKLAHKIAKVGVNDVTPATVVSDKKLNGTPIGEQVGITTIYDSWTNCIIRDIIVYAGGVKLANMVRPFPNATGDPAVRHIVFSQRDSATGTWTYNDVFGGAAGWPDIDVSRSGSNLGTIGIVGHTPSRLAVWDGTAFQVATFGPATDPSFQFSGDNIFLGNSGNRTQFQMYKSTDGTTFTNFDSISAFGPSPKDVFWTANGSVEMGLSKSPDETQLVYYGVNGGNGAEFDGVPADSCDNVFAISSPDGGTTWTPKKLAIDGHKGLVAAYPTYAPWFNYWDQMDLSVTNAGTIHAVAGGFGYNFNTPDTTLWFPVLYYNSKSNTWITISNHAIDTMQNLFTWAAGRHQGNSFPSVSVSEDGKLVYVCWAGPQMTGNVLDTASDGATGPYYYRDLYHTWSVDGGATFKTPTVFSTEKTVSEEYPTAPQTLRFDATQGKYVADICYLAHLGSGAFIQDGSPSYNDPIMYYAFTIPDVPTTGVNDGKQVVRSFNLEQNYPNPFNPSTKISYTLSEKSNVTLKVFDMLGREVASLINGSQEAGQHNVSFDASKLASGVYVYTLKSNSNVMSKKMMLMK